MTFRQGLLRARSHIVIIVVLIVAGSIIVRIEDRNLAKETGKVVPDHGAVARATSAGR